ncbi:hypothetical protein QBC37DRAFT_484198 [Rhypophila decipiens]|uniref:Uncharacterized protein n=1 Tax=Rhypophila decipiens TaxID=261697 RepID=A0AAN6Y4A8_9PEZI|nr:hypothetical protein QBC37DRAFT_484198 [Rhypophila decipiens]
MGKDEEILKLQLQSGLLPHLEVAGGESKRISDRKSGRLGGGLGDRSQRANHDGYGVPLLRGMISAQERVCAMQWNKLQRRRVDHRQGTGIWVGARTWIDDGGDMCSTAKDPGHFDANPSNQHSHISKLHAKLQGVRGSAVVESLDSSPDPWSLGATKRQADGWKNIPAHQEAVRNLSMGLEKGVLLQWDLGAVSPSTGLPNGKGEGGRSKFSSRLLNHFFMTFPRSVFGHVSDLQLGLWYAVHLSSLGSVHPLADVSPTQSHRLSRTSESVSTGNCSNAPFLASLEHFYPSNPRLLSGYEVTGLPAPRYTRIDWLGGTDRMNPPMRRVRLGSEPSVSNTQNISQEVEQPAARIQLLSQPSL